MGDGDVFHDGFIALALLDPPLGFQGDLGGGGRLKLTGIGLALGGGHLELAADILYVLPVEF